jgi:hypothetical protein
MTMGSSAAFRYYARNVLAKQGLRRVEQSNIGVNALTLAKPLPVADANMTDELLCNIAYSHSQAESSRFSVLLNAANMRMMKQLKMSQNQLKR